MEVEEAEAEVVEEVTMEHGEVTMEEGEVSTVEVEEVASKV